jgi:hypothetical protein
VFLICLDDGGDNECTGKFYYNRSSGHDGSGFVDIVISSKLTAGDTPHGFCSYQTAYTYSNSTTPHRFSLITGTFSGVSYVGLKYEGGDAFPFGDTYFDGLWKSTGTNTPFELKLSSTVTSQTALDLSNSEVSLQNKRLVIDTDGDVTIAGNLTTSDAAGSTSIISGIKINRDSSELVTFQAPDDELMFAYNTTNGVNAVEGQNRLDLRVNSNTKLSVRSSGVRIGNNGAATEMLDVVGNAKISGELTAPTVKHSDDFCRFYKSNNTELSGAQTSYLNVFETTSLSSTKVTQTTTSRYTINKAGYYKIFANMIYENTSYNERVVYRAQIIINGNIDIRQYGDSFVYARDSRFGELGSAPVSTFLNLSVNDYVEIYVTLKKALSGFGIQMSGTRVRLGSSIDFEYLGT